MELFSHIKWLSSGFILLRNRMMELVVRLELLFVTAYFPSSVSVYVDYDEVGAEWLGHKCGGGRVRTDASSTTAGKNVEWVRWFLSFSMEEWLHTGGGGSCRTGSFLVQGLSISV